MNSFLLLCDVFSFVFWENPRLDWFAFEINRPLVGGSFTNHVFKRRRAGSPKMLTFGVALGAVDHGTYYVQNGKWQHTYSGGNILMILYRRTHFIMFGMTLFRI